VTWATATAINCFVLIGSAPIREYLLAERLEGVVDFRSEPLARIRQGS
jgi:hypothetical protein